MIVAAFVLFAVAILLSAAARRPDETGPPDEAGRRVRLQVSLAWLLNTAGAAGAAAVGARALAGTPERLGLGDIADLGAAALAVDRLSGLFLVISFCIAVPVVLVGASRETYLRPRLPAAIAMTLASVLVIETADHLFVLLFGWEGLTFAFYLLTGYDRARVGRARAAVGAATFGKASGALLLIGGAVLFADTHSFDLAGFAAAHGADRQVGYGLLLLGFAIKVGIIPMQVWLPPAYAAAPGPARAVMAGVAVNVGFYGMWRTLLVLGPAPVWLATLVLVIAGITAILGIAHAAVHPDLAQLVAWSSVENAGVITAGFGVALVGSAVADPRLEAAGLLAATAQVIAHALGKSLLYTATNAIEHATGTTDLGQLRGIARRMPFAGAGLVVGSLTLAGMPLTAGFASEWLTLESLMQQFRVARLPLQLGAATAGALVALTVGVAGVTFVRLIALTAFGRPATVEPAHTRPDRSTTFRVGAVMLSVACLGVAAVAPLEIRLLVRGLAQLSGSAGRSALASPWVIQPVFGAFSALSPSWLWIAIPALSAIAVLVTVAFSGTRMFRVRRVPVWSSASPGVDRGVGYTSFGYANPMRKVLANLLLTSSQLRPDGQPATGGAAAPDTVDDDKFGLARAVQTGLSYQVDVVEVIEHYLYRPAEAALLAAARLAKRLQSGRLDAYMAYMLIALVAVLALVTATA